MKKITFILTFFSVALFSCKKKGCTDPGALNYNSKAGLDCCCEYNGFISFYTRTGYQNGQIGIYIDSSFVKNMSGIYVGSSDPTCNTSGHPSGTAVFLEDGTHYYQCIQSDSVLTSGYITTARNSCYFVEVNN